MKNALTIDVEEWFHVCCPGHSVEESSFERRVHGCVGLILALLEENGLKATFFILGSVAEAEPTLAQRIASAGHEIASHGWSHRLVPQLEAIDFRQEIRRTADLLERQTGRRPVGFRAPQWSLGKKTPWAFEILREEGYRYDSSLNPLPFVGNRRGPLFPHRHAGGLLEFPPLVTQFPGINLPTGGGWGFRLFPERFVIAGIEHLNRQRLPAILYLHPREMEPHGPRMKLSPLREFAAYGPRKSPEGRLRRLLKRYQFTTLEHLADLWDTAL